MSDHATAIAALQGALWVCYALTWGMVGVVALFLHAYRELQREGYNYSGRRRHFRIFALWEAGYNAASAAMTTYVFGLVELVWLAPAVAALTIWWIDWRFNGGGRGIGDRLRSLLPSAGQGDAA